MKLIYPKKLTKWMTIGGIMLCIWDLCIGYNHLRLGIVGEPASHLSGGDPIGRAIAGIVITLPIVFVLFYTGLKFEIKYEKIAMCFFATGALFYGLSPLATLRFNLGIVGVIFAILGTACILISLISLIINLRRY